MLHIVDLAYLNAHPLAAALRPAPGAPGVRLRQLLVQAIEELRPPGLHPQGRPSRHRLHAILRLRYVEGQRVAQIRRQLAISSSQYYREHDRALAALAVVVAPRLEGDPQVPPVAEGHPRAPSGRAPLNEALPFVGREAELDLLQEAFASVAAGRGGHLVLIGGGMGIGKTRLAEELGLLAAGTGGRYLAGRYLRGAAAAYAPWVDALATPLAVLTRREAVRLAGPYRTRLSHLFPLLRSGPRHTPDESLGPGDVRYQLYEGLVHLLRGFAERQPLVLLIDDLQWAPDLGLLRHLAGHLGGTRALVLATLRHPEFEQRAELAREHADLVRLGPVTVIELAPLDPAETAVLVGSVLGGDVAARLGPAVHRRTGGHPLFIEETLRARLQAGTADRSIPLPPSLRAAVRARVERLGSVAGRVLAQAALLGETFGFGELLSLSGLPEELLSEVLASAMEARLIDDRWRDGAEWYAFRDEHVREALYDSVQTPVRRRWHRRAAEALQASSGLGAERDAELARHFIEAGDAAQGAGYALRAGCNAEAAYDWSAAAAHHRTALALWERIGGHEAERAEACRRLGDVTFFSGIDVGQGIAYLQRSLALYIELGHEVDVAGLHVRLGRELTTSLDLRIRDLPAALGHLDAARRILEAHPEQCESACTASIELASAHAYALNGRAAVAAAGRASELARQAGNRVLTVWAEGLEGGLLAATGRIAEGLDLLDRAQHAAQEAGLRWHADNLLWIRCFPECYLHPARVAALAGDMPAAASTPSRLFIPAVVLGACAYTGALDRGETLRVRMAQTLATAGLPAFGPDPQHCGRLLLRRGDWEAAEELLVAALVWSETAGDRSHEAWVRQALGELYLARGDLDRAEAALAAAARLQRDGDAVLALADCLASHTRCLAAMGRMVDAETALAELEQILAAREDWGRLAATTALAEGVVRSLGRRREAEDRFRRALEIFRAEGLRWDEAFTLDCWGRSLGETGKSGGTDLQREAQALWTALGAGRYAERRAR